MNAFELSDELAKTRQGRAAKDGELAPMDIVVEKDLPNSVRAPLLVSSMLSEYLAKSTKAKFRFRKLSQLWKKAILYRLIWELC